LLIVTGADVVLFPDVSVATAVIVCWPGGSAPVDHHTVPVLQLAAPAPDRLHQRPRPRGPDS